MWIEVILEWVEVWLEGWELFWGNVDCKYKRNFWKSFEKFN